MTFKNRLIWLGGILLITLGTGALSEGLNIVDSENGEIEITDNTFGCIQDMTKVRGFYVDNLMGDIEATVAVANLENGGKYPPGSVVQLVPGEVMVKHETGFNPATLDWEFFELDVADTGSEIRKRGFVDVVNRFGGNCFGCHIQAKPQWDMICDSGHGCQTIPITKKTIDLIQKTDPRCMNNEKLTRSESFDLMKLKAKVTIGTAIGTVKGWF